MRMYILLFLTAIFFIGCGSSSKRYVYYKTAPNPNKVFVDSTTGLTWADDKRPNWFSGNYQGTINYCKKSTLAGFNDWRVPSIQELVTLIDYKKQTSWVKGYKLSYRTMIKDEFRGLRILPGGFGSNFISSTLNSDGKYLGLKGTSKNTF